MADTWTERHDLGNDYELVADADGFLQVRSGGSAEVVFYTPDDAEAPAESTAGIILGPGEGLDTARHPGNAYARSSASGEVIMTFTPDAA